MRTMILLSFVFLSAFAHAGLISAASPAPTTATGIPVDTLWKQKVYAFAQQYVVLFASAFLHDVGEDFLHFIKKTLTMLCARCNVETCRSFS